MLLCFELSMPNVGSWNSKWSGEGRLYAKVVNIGRKKENIEKGNKMLKRGYFIYDFKDGWTAGISVRKVDSKEARKIRRLSKGFYGYDWMIDSIIEYGEIIKDYTIKG